MNLFQNMTPEHIVTSHFSVLPKCLRGAQYFFGFYTSKSTPKVNIFPNMTQQKLKKQSLLNPTRFYRKTSCIFSIIHPFLACFDISVCPDHGYRYYDEYCYKLFSQYNRCSIFRNN
jgi:hypothetical protein